MAIDTTLKPGADSFQYQNIVFDFSKLFTIFFKKISRIINLYSRQYKLNVIERFISKSVCKYLQVFWIFLEYFING